MVKTRVLISLLTIFVLIFFGGIAVFYARGFRLQRSDDAQIEISTRGLLSITTEPNAAEVYVDGELKTASNATISLEPGEYAVRVRKEGFLPWEKTIKIEKEVVTPVFVSLVSSAPSLSALTSQGAINPTLSYDGTKLAYGRSSEDKNEADKNGIWVYELTSLPLGFNRQPRQITDADTRSSTWEWSFDGSSLLINTKTGSFLIDTNTFTAIREARALTPAQIEELKSDWNNSKNLQTEAQLSSVEDAVKASLIPSSAQRTMSPDETKVLYDATKSATLVRAERQLPGSSTQTETRELKAGYKYVYDIKEDRNFEVGKSEDLLMWSNNSHNLIQVEKGSISVKDYDNTNKQLVFAGNFLYPYVFSGLGGGRILITTSLGAEGDANLYWLVLR